MEQRQLAWLITMRSQVRVLVPQPNKIFQKEIGSKTSLFLFALNYHLCN